jgi:hypothetical protein
MSADIIDLEEVVETWAWNSYNRTRIEKPFSNPTEASATSPGAAKVRPTLNPLVHPFVKELVQVANTGILSVAR